MVKTGLCSVTFKQKTPRTIIELAANAGLSGIEWISSVHVKEGDIYTASEVRKMTKDAGIEVAAYGSLFRLGKDMDIIPYLESAKALGASEMRIWAGGEKPSVEFSADERKEIIRQARSASEKAAEYGISLSTECHDNSLTDCIKSQLAFMEEVDRDNFNTYWQELLTLPESEQLPSLKSVHNSGKLTNIHVYQYKLFDGGRERRYLSEGFEKWKERFSVFANDTKTHYAMLEFVRDDSVESFVEDAKTLCKLAEYANV